jgi:BTB/POZ domain
MMMMATAATTTATAADSATEMTRPPAPPSPPRTTGDSLTTTTYHYNKQLLHTGAFADCTILCRPQDLSYSSRSTTSTSRPAHRNVLAPRCDFFRCCFEGAFQEARTPCVVDMRGDDPVAVDGLLYYLYTLEYPAEVYERVLFAGAGLGSGCSDSGIEDEDEDEDEASKGQAPGLDPRVYWGFDLLMHDVADKYGLLGLREMAARSLLAKAELVGKETEAREEGEKQQQQQQRRQVVKTLDGFVALMEDLYPAEEDSQEAEQEEGNDLRRSLRRQVVRLTCQGIARHIRDERISTLMADVPGFAVELVEMLAEKGNERRMVQREEDKKEEALKARLSHVPMNEESDCED